ncbi:hypothetical protein HBH98_134820 [Parastagonospora nodorum]|nr:hypothetical protein HBH98_134820 [Parastagonospora nodorum]KAH4373799.1 hypothetical protein HBH97_125680 [Parastagonospora nodorum]KAH4420777.1 hypothetical protein HBH99_052400 [Parastagonospora nodorum]KAH4899655.1 hypothetical protein HBI80_164930 [Parastagonospora nodorum]KAH5279763.1 hypothetical protein HBI70_079130 [Parastagonospora nodorum]
MGTVTLRSGHYTTFGCFSASRVREGLERPHGSVVANRPGWVHGGPAAYAASTRLRLSQPRWHHGSTRRVHREEISRSFCMTSTA